MIHTYRQSSHEPIKTFPGSKDFSRSWETSRIREQQRSGSSVPALDDGHTTMALFLSNVETFDILISINSDPEKVAGSIAKALLEGRVVKAEVSGTEVLGKTMLALGIAASLTRKNGGRMEVFFPNTDIRTDTVRLNIIGKPA